MTKPIYFTEEGLKKIKQELRFLETTERKRITELIAEARAHGDLSENAEYDAAKEAQSMLEKRISELTETVRDARLVDDSKIDASKAYILSTVRVRNLKVNREFSYMLVSPPEADFSKGRISVKSPIGAALLGRTVGDKVSVKTPSGVIKLEILEIER